MRTIKTMIKRTLEKTLSITAVWLLLGAGGPANAAKLLGLDFADLDTADTANIILFDTAAGTSILLGDTGLTRCDHGHDCPFPGLSPNGEFGPNGIAYNEVTGVAYYAAIPNFGDTRTLWSMAIDPQPPGSPESLGPLFGTPFSATFFDGLYWYVDNGTLALRKVSFTADGSVFADDFVGDLPVTSAGATGLRFGDITVDQDGLLYGSGDIVGGVDDGKVLLFTVLLTDADPVSTYMTLSIAPDSTNPKMQLSFGGDGTLFGHASNGGSASILYYVSVVPDQLGARAEILTGIDGGPFTDLSSFNSLCSCTVPPPMRMMIDDGRAG